MLSCSAFRGVPDLSAVRCMSFSEDKVGRAFVPLVRCKGNTEKRYFQISSPSSVKFLLKSEDEFYFVYFFHYYITSIQLIVCRLHNTIVSTFSSEIWRGNLKRKAEEKGAEEKGSRRERKQKRATPPKESEQDSPAGFPLLLSRGMPPLSSGCWLLSPGCLFSPRDASPFSSADSLRCRSIYWCKSRNLSFVDRKIIFLQNES